MTEVRALAFYLPQFHPIPENDAWWGRGFTEWTNVARARPLYRDHYQPHFPSDLGYYDLRVPEVRAAQADLARGAGIHGFCYYHYWFGGRRLLERPFDEVLSSGQPDFPFALCWANENWTRVWDGGANEVLMPQQYSDEDDRRHLTWLATAFRDDRYIRVDGKPLFLVYRANALRDARRTTQIWREEARRLGVGELYLCRVESFADERDVDPESQGFDAAVEWIPDPAFLGRPMFRDSVRARLASRTSRLARPVDAHKVFAYDTVVEHALQRDASPPSSYVRHPCVVPAWDNSSRRKSGAMILHGSTPGAYARWLESAAARAARTDEGLLFISAWNEWAEGNHLEPDARWGHAYLDATAEVMSRFS